MSDELVVDIEDMEEDDIQDFNLSNSQEEIEYPHFKFDTDELKKFLGVAKNIISTSNSDSITNSIFLTEENDKLILRVTDLDVYLEYEVDLKNEVNVLEDNVFIPLDIIQKLIKATQEESVIYKKEGDYFLTLIGGDMVLETSDAEEEGFRYDGEEEKLKEVNSEELFNVVKDLGNLAISAVSPKEKRVYLYDNEAYANYMWAGVKAKKSFVNMDLQVKDIKVMKKLLDGVEEELKVYNLNSSDVNRKIIEGDGFRYVFIISDLDVSASIKESIEEADIEEGIYIECDYLNKLVEIASSLPYSTGKILMNYAEGNKLNLTIKTQSEMDSEFQLPGAVAGGDLESLSDDVIVQAEYFKVLLKVFSDYSAIKIGVIEQGISFEAEDYRAILGAEV